MTTQRILVIDDEAAILEVIQGCLEELGGYEVLTAASGKAGLELARSHHPSAILLDVSMPVMDGLMVLQSLRTQPETALIPVALLTARVQPADRAIFAQLGVAGVIQKPFDPVELVDQVMGAFGWQPLK